MRNFYSYLSNYNISLALTLGIFTSNILVCPVYSQQIDLNDVALAVRLGKLFDSAKKNLKKKDFKGLMKDTIKLQEEVEYLTGKRVDLDRCIDEAFHEAKKKSKYKLDSKLEKAVKKIIKSKGKDFDKKVKFLMHGINYIIDEANVDSDFVNNDEIFELFLEKPKDKHGNEIKEIVIPLNILIGVTSTMAGVLIGIVPIQVPRKAEVVTFFVTTGIGYIVDGIKEIAEQQREAEKVGAM